MRIHVEEDKCQGHNRCKAIAPNLFDLDEFGNASAANDGVVPAGQEEFKKLNADLSKKWPVLAEKKAAPPDAKQWEGVADKRKLLEE